MSASREWKRKFMQAVRALYDGTTLRPLPSEQLPQVESETPVIVIFEEPSVSSEEASRCQRREALERLRAARLATPPLEDDIREMIEDGRYR